VVCKLVWILTGRTIVDVTRHVSLAVRRCGQIGSARSESKIVAANVPVVGVVATTSRGLLKVCIEIFFVFSLANFLDQEEDCAYNDGGTD